MRQIRWLVVVWLMVGIALATNAQAEEKKSKVGLNLSVISDFNYSRSNVPQDLPENWQARYQPPGGSMEIDRNDYGLFWDLGLGLEPTLTTPNDWGFGLPIFYTVACIGSGGDIHIGDKPVTRTELNWWDPVPLLKVNLRKTSPAVGISVRKAHWKVQYALQNYKIFIEDFRGVDVSGGQNYAEVVEKRDVDSGRGQRLDISYLFYEPGEREGKSVGVYYERNGSKVWLVGISLKYTWPIKK